MSVVTNVIFVHGVLEAPMPGAMDDDERYLNVEALNAELARFDIPGWLGNVSKHAGGPKRMECMVYLCAFNFLDEHRLIEAIESLHWKRPDAVQLFMMRQDENQFSETLLFERRQNRRT